MRRTLLGWMYRNKQNRCYWCGKTLNKVEREYYDNSCEKCEQKITNELSKE